MVSKKLMIAVIVQIEIIVVCIMLLLLFRQPTMGEMVPTELASFFDTFDLDGDNAVSIGESQNFYSWCKTNIHYRYDDENQFLTSPGITVGDGRPGVDYWQDPIETFEEGMGDCEDMAILSVAFYRYYNVQAYLATVNAESEEVDHAVCIVRLGSDPQEVEEFLGGIVYYTIDNEYYLLVDVSYSNQFGSAGSSPAEASWLLEQGRFEIQDKITLEQAYKVD